ncbi:hypothetical protein DAPPUDRAFT_338827, partial [Daphnia pulex]
MYKWDAKKTKLAFHVSAKKQWNLLVQRDNNHHQSRSPPLVRTLTGDRFLSGSMSVESTEESMVMMLPVHMFL